MKKSIEFRGKTFYIESLDTYPQHASWTSFEDEINVKEAFWHPKLGDVVLDIGAAFGSYALTALSEGASKVYAWSPQGHPGETEQEVLMKSAEHNGWSDRITVYCTGLYDCPGWLHAVTLEYRGILEEPPCEDEFVGRTSENWLSVDTLDRWWGGCVDWWGGRVEPKPVDLMKLDVEGAELDVLRGATWVLKTCKPSILVEHHLFKKPDLLETIPAYLKPLGYELVGTLRYSESCTHGLYVHESRR